MPMITVEHPKGRLSAAQKERLAERLTHVLLEIEGGRDTPGGRSIAWVKFRDVEVGDWFIGGRSDGSYEAAAGRFLVELNTPEGSMDQPRKALAQKGICDAILDVLGLTSDNGAARSIWIQHFEWPEGQMSTSGRTSPLFGIAKIAGIPDDDPILDFARSYFSAKAALMDEHAFPSEASGRSLVGIGEAGSS